MAYSTDLRKRTLEYVEPGNPQTEAVNLFGVSLKTVWNWVKQKKEGQTSPKKKDVLPRKIDEQRLLHYVKNNPDAYLREIAEIFQVTEAAIFYACKRLKITLKKRARSIKSEMKKNGKHFRKS